MILHICVADKFIDPFISYINDTFSSEDHLFFVINKKNKFSFHPHKNLVLKSNFGISESLELRKYTKRADKIILHGLLWNNIVRFLALDASNLKKCYWGIWGGDLYVYRDRNKNLKFKFWHLMRTFVIRRISHFITSLPGDYELAQEWYKTKAEYHESFVYLSNVYHPVKIGPPAESKSHPLILLGNSARSTNRHEDAFKKLLKYKGQIKIIAPLSYGTHKYGKRIAKMGNEMFGNDFKALMDFIPLEEYHKLLAGIDTVVFNHDRQQGMGNLIQLLGQGKKVFLDTTTPQYRLFKEMGVEVFDVNNIDLEPLDDETKRKNEEIISHYFSKENLKVQLTKLFGTP